MRLTKVTGMKIKVGKWILLPFVSIFGATLITKLLCTFFDTSEKMTLPITVCAIIYIIFCFALGAIKAEDFKIKFAAKKRRLSQSTGVTTQ